MNTLTIQIKNMVCPRCILIVQQTLSQLKIEFYEVGQGFALVNPEPFPDLNQLNDKLEKLGLGLVKDQNELVVSEIINQVHHYINNMTTNSQEGKLSSYLANELARNYHQLSKLFSKYQGITIEQFFIQCRVDKVKEFIRQGKMNYSQIAISLGYSSIQYLSGQFKKVTGITLSEYQKNWDEQLIRLAQREENHVVADGCRSDCNSKDCTCEHSSSQEDNAVELRNTSLLGVSVNGRLGLIDSIREFKIQSYG